MTPATIEFQLDADYFREFHEEWVASVGRGWRVDRVMVRIFVAGGLGLALIGLLLSTPTVSIPGALFSFFGALEFVKGRRKRSRWLSYAESLPWNGRRVRFEVENGALVQKVGFDGSAPLLRPAGLVETPNGYLFTLPLAPDLEVSDGALSSTKSSLYVPHRQIQPTMTREKFRSLLR